MTNKFKGGVAAIAILASATASAQTLSTTVTVDRVVEPTLRQATRPAWAPQMLPLSTQAVSLTPAEYSGEGTLLSTATPLPPLMWADRIERTPYRGYASLGYFPAVNLGANAGYRFVDTESTAIGAWMQYDGNQYKRLSESNDFSRDVKLRNHYVTVGAYGSYRVGPSHEHRGSELNAGVDYTYANVQRPSWTREEGYAQGSNELNARLSWRSSVGRFGYALSARYQYFGFNDSDIDVVNDYGVRLSPIKQSLFVVQADLAYLRRDYDKPAIFQMGIEWQNLHTSDAYEPSNMGLLKLYPHFNVGTGPFRAKLGVKGFVLIDVSNSGYLPLILPDVRLSWAPASLPLSLYANATFDWDFITNARLFAIDPYVSTRLWHDTSSQFRVDFGANLGAFRGFSLQARVSFAATGHLLHPLMTSTSGQLPVWASPYAGTQFLSSDIASWLIGATLRYDYGSLVSASLSYDYAPARRLISWYQWLDGARNSIRADVKVRPIAPLTASLSYELRPDRHVAWTRVGDYSLRTASLLSLGASYDVTPALTVFLNAENLLNCRYLMISALPAQGIHGLAGLTLKF